MNKAKLNLEKTVEFLTKCALQGVLIKYCADTKQEALAFFENANIGDFFYSKDGIEEQQQEGLYVVTESGEGEKTALYLGEFPAKGDTGAQGPQGSQGTSPTVTIGDNGNWYVNDVDTGKPSRGITGKGTKGDPGKGVENMTEISSTGYTPTVTEGTDYSTYSTSADIKYNDAGQQTIKTVIFKYLVKNFPQVLEDLAEYIEVDSEGSVTFGHDVYTDGNLQAGNDVEVGRNLYIDDMTKLQDPDGNQLLKQADWTETDINSPAYIQHKPTLPSAQIQSDYTQTDTSAVDYIKNKPNLATVATSGSYNDLTDKPATPTVLTAGDGIDISNAVVSVKLGTGLFFDSNDAIILNAYNQNAIDSVSSKEASANKVTSISSSSTDTEYPSAKCVYDIVGNVESALEALL